MDVSAPHLGHPHAAQRNPGHIQPSELAIVVCRGLLDRASGPGLTLTDAPLDPLTDRWSVLEHLDGSGLGRRPLSLGLLGLPQSLSACRGAGPGAVLHESSLTRDPGLGVCLVGEGAGAVVPLPIGPQIAPLVPAARELANVPEPPLPHPQP